MKVSPSLVFHEEISIFMDSKRIVGNNVCLKDFPLK